MKKLKIYFFVCLVFVPVLGFSQNYKNDPIAEELFNTYHKFGLQTGISSLFVENEPNAVSLKYEKPRTFEIGATYNFYQYKNFNFSFSALYRTHSLTNYENTKKEDTGLPLDIAGRLTVGPYHQYKLNTEAHYYFNVFNFTTAYFSLGPELTLTRRIYGTTTVVSENEESYGYTAVDDYNGTFFIGANISFGFNIKTKPLLFQPFFTYHYQPKTLFTNVVTTQNLKVSENTVSEHHITGNYIMVGLKLYRVEVCFKL